jgi:hypothetical protein
MKKTILMIIFITCIFISICPSGVIPEENQTILDNQTREYGPRCRWVPSKAQTSKALEAIYTFLKTEITPDWRNRQRKDIQDQISSYHVQFVGTIIDGRKAIHCNFFQEEGGFNHDKYTYVLVLDGGTSYWRINYDIDKNKCFDFEVNGEA